MVGYILLLAMLEIVDANKPKRFADDTSDS